MIVDLQKLIGDYRISTLDLTAPAIDISYPGHWSAGKIRRFRVRFFELLTEFAEDTNGNNSREDSTMGDQSSEEGS